MGLRWPGDAWLWQNPSRNESGLIASPDLATVIRPQLNALDATLLPALARMQARRSTPDCPGLRGQDTDRLENDDGLWRIALCSAAHRGVPSMR